MYVTALVDVHLLSFKDYVFYGVEHTESLTAKERLFGEDVIAWPKLARPQDMRPWLSDGSPERNDSAPDGWTTNAGQI